MIGRGAKNLGLAWVARVVTAGVLVCAAILKAPQVMAVDAPLSDTFDFGTTFLIVAELLLAVLLLCRVYAALTKWAVVGVFGVFALYSSWQIYDGESECGCFGAPGVSPVVTLAIDLFIMVSMVAAPSPRWSAMRHVVELKALMVAVFAWVVVTPLIFFRGYVAALGG